MKGFSLHKIRSTFKSIAHSLGRNARSGVASRQAKYGSNALLSIFIFLAILVVLNLIFKNAGLRYDTTKNKVYSLSPETIKVIKDVKDQVKVTAFFTPQADPEARRLLEEYSSRNANLKVEFVDPLVKVATAERYGIMRDGTVIFEKGNRKEETTTATETEFTSALIKLSTNEKVNVVFWQGSGEKDPEKTTDDGYSYVKESLERLNYTVTKQDAFLTDRVASNAGVLVIAGPQNTYGQKQIDAFNSFVAGGGKVLVMLDPKLNGGVTGLESSIGKFGIELRNGIILDPQSLQRTGELALVAAAEYGTSQITESLTPTIFPLAMAASISRNPPGFLTIDSLASSGEESWLETDLANTQNPTKGNTDVNGPLPMAVAIRQTESTNDPASKQRLVVIGDSDFAMNLFIRPEQGKATYVPGNLDLVVNSVNWLASRENLINIAPKERNLEPVTLDMQQARFIQYFTVFGLPGIVILLGITNWWRRRQSRNKRLREVA